MKLSLVNNGSRLVFFAVLLCVLPVHLAYAGWGEFLKDIFSDENTETVGKGISGLSNSDVIAGLKQALSQGTNNAIRSLGKTDGFFANKKVKIPMPEKLQMVETALRKMKQDEMADEFVLTMNRAAEQAVPETADVFAESIKQMTIEDARSILNGPDNAATKYFRKTSGERLSEKILPIVKQATGRAGVTRQYKKLIDQLGFMSNIIDVQSLDLDRYVTDKSVDGLFTLLADEEKLIRTDPAARTTELLKQVFKN